jgi:hypothetical protein
MADNCHPFLASLRVSLLGFSSVRKFSASSTRECNGLKFCAPGKFPWVVAQRSLSLGIATREDEEKFRQKEIFVIMNLPVCQECLLIQSF